MEQSATMKNTRLAGQGGGNAFSLAASDCSSTMSTAVASRQASLEEDATGLLDDYVSLEDANHSPWLLVDGFAACLNTEDLPSAWQLLEQSSILCSEEADIEESIAVGATADSESPAGTLRGDEQAPLEQQVPGCVSRPGAGVWVTKWVECSNYGLGYTLSNGTIGWLFNDSTKIIQAGASFDYITRATTEAAPERQSYTFDEYPEDLKKKVTLLKHLNNYLMTGAMNSSKTSVTTRASRLPTELQSTAIGSHSEEAVYVRRWKRCRRGDEDVGSVVVMSNKAVQAMFFADKTELVVESNTVAYLDTSGQVTSCSLPLEQDATHRAAVSSRLRYLRGVLRQ
eukprot:TRINITY_DN39014_c0_g1_i1.p1 TRINITY_DN39014_c0_g1~~TRINITY_DN39014_c0_g1_i1.p1  ORF type:complete len:341 (+),score=45.07 TRINITY_DN39014_c0_g1_i1:136-1158(+)